jgi:hypothetical protein
VKIDIVIDKTGKMEFHLDGVYGGSCVGVLDRLRDRIPDAKEEDRKDTDDMHVQVACDTRVQT